MTRHQQPHSSGAGKGDSKGPVHACSITNYLKKYNADVHFLLDQCCIGNMTNPQRPHDGSEGRLLTLFVIPHKDDVDKLMEIIDSREISHTADIILKKFMFTVESGEPRDSLSGCSLHARSRNSGPASVEDGAIDGLPVKSTGASVADSGRGNAAGFIWQATKPILDANGEVKGGVHGGTVTGGTMRVNNKVDVLKAASVLMAIEKFNSNKGTDGNNMFLCAANGFWALQASRGRQNLIFRDLNPYFDLAMILGFALKENAEFFPVDKNIVMDYGINLVEVDPLALLFSVAPPLPVDQCKTLCESAARTRQNLCNSITNSTPHDSAINSITEAYRSVFANCGPAVDPSVRIHLDFLRFRYATVWTNSPDTGSNIFYNAFTSILGLNKDYSLPKAGFLSTTCAVQVLKFIESDYFLYVYTGNDETGGMMSRHGQLGEVANLINQSNARNSVSRADIEKLCGH